MMNTDVICPYCEQDRVWRVAISETKLGVFPHSFCYECDTFWEDGEIINDQTGVTFKYYLQERGRKLDYKILRRGPPAGSENGPHSAGPSDG